MTHPSIYYSLFLYILGSSWTSVPSFRSSVQSFPAARAIAHFSHWLGSESSVFALPNSNPGMFTRASHRHSSCSSEALGAFQIRSYHLHLRPHSLSIPQAAALLPRPPFDRKLVGSESPNPNRAASSGVAVRNTLKSRGQNLRFCRSSSLTPTSDTTSFSFLSTPHTSQHRAFSSTPSAMTAAKIDGTAIAKKIRERLHAEIEATQKVNPRYKPSLKIIQGRPRAQPSIDNR